jgi:ATP-dependent DNA helicase RecQ
MQQLGRAGRDGEPAVALLLYREADLGLQKSLSSPAKLEPDKVADVVDAIRAEPGALDVATLSERTGQTNGKLNRTIQLLEAEQAIHVKVTGEATALDRRTHPSDVAEAVVAQQDRFRDWRDERIARMRAYALTTACRRQALLDYFGEPAPPTCNTCDNCRAGLSRHAAKEKRKADDRHEWPVNGAVMHKTLGRGIVQGYEAGNVHVLFERSGRKAISVEFAKRKKLMTAEA